MIHRVAQHTLERQDERLIRDAVPFTGRAYQGRADQPDDEQEYLNGRAHGLGRAWHPNGALAQQRQYVDSQLHGLRQEWDTLGRMRLLEFWELGIRLWRLRWDEAGTRIEDTQISEADAQTLAARREALWNQQHQRRDLGAASTWRSVLPDRIDRDSVQYGDADGLYYLDDQPFSGWVYTGSAALPNSEAAFLNGLRWGLSREWDRAGALAEQAQWVDDVLHGIAQEWSREGHLLVLDCCEIGVVLWHQEWDQQGNLRDSYQLDPLDGSLSTLHLYRETLLRDQHQHRDDAVTGTTES
jgi:antitoxin component YwqK of YwqJK toxin-antitoxin module